MKLIKSTEMTTESLRLTNNNYISNEIVAESIVEGICSIMPRKTLLVFDYLSHENHSVTIDIPLLLGKPYRR